MKLSGYRRHLCSTKAVHYHVRAAMKPNTAEDPAAESSNILRCYDQKDERVLLETANFIVINKPFDVRMNGDFDVTTEKLLVHWFANTTTKSFKFVHELDYATSGAVCVARNKDAAAIASSSFANRLTHKKYLAVLQGHLDISKWPLRDERIAASYVSQPKKKAKTDYDSVSKQDDEWQVEVMTENLAVSYSAFEALSTRRRCGDPSLQQQELISTLQRVSIEQFKKDSRLRKTLRKVLRANGIELALAPSVKPVPLLADVAAEVPVEGQNEQLLQQTGGQAMPHETVYRIRDDSAQGGQTLIVSVPLTELPGDFRCASAAPPLGKASETEVRVLALCTYGGAPVTKVSFKPITGRRHQLRVHSLRLGHPIVGDVTYNSAAAARSAPRMLLHALALDIPAPFDCNKYLGGRSSFVGAADVSEGSSLVSVATEDPFVVDGAGALHVSLY